MKAMGRGFSASPFKTFTIKLKAAATRGIPESRDSKVCERLGTFYCNIVRHP